MLLPLPPLSKFRGPLLDGNRDFHKIIQRKTGKGSGKARRRSWKGFVGNENQGYPWNKKKLKKYFVPFLDITEKEN